MSQLRQRQTDLDHLRPLQFSMRSLLIVTAVVAVAFAALTPYLRQFPARNVTVVVVAWLGGLLLFCGLMLIFSRRWTLRYRLAGEPLFVFVREAGAPWAAVFMVASCLQAAVALWLSRRLLDPRAELSPAGLFLLAESLCLFVVLGVLHLNMMYRSRSSFLCQNGVLHQSCFVPWSEVARDEYATDREELRIVRRCDEANPLKILLAGVDRRAVEEVLQQVRPRYGGAKIEAIVLEQEES